MRINLPLSAAGALFDDLNARTELSAELAQVREALRPLCEVDLTWRPHGHRSLPCIHGLGWAVMYNECPTDSDAPETSLRDLDADHCYVLLGDHRNAFTEVAPQGFTALKQLYDELNLSPENRCGFSDDAR